MTCRCAQIDELRDRLADEYARDHLVEIVSDPKSWDTLYRCPETGLYWRMEFPGSAQHGGGAPVLRKVGRAIPDSFAQLLRNSEGR